MAKLLATICPDGYKLFDSSSVHEAPVYGSTAPQTAAVDSSDLAPPTSKLLLQQVHVSCTCSFPSVGPIVLPRACTASVLSHSTVDDAGRAVVTVVAVCSNARS
jgi:hypothetical protein